MRTASREKALVASLALALVSCGSQDDDAPATSTVDPGTYVGVVDGSDTRVGVVAGASGTVVFVCGGASSMPETAWLEGPRADGTSTTLASATRTLLLRGEAGARAVTGTVSGGPAPRTFRAERVPDGSTAGIYEGRDAEGRYGVVLDTNGTPQGAFVKKGGGLSQQIIVIRPEAATFRVELEGRSVLLERVVAR